MPTTLLQNIDGSGELGLGEIHRLGMIQLGNAAGIQRGDARRLLRRAGHSRRRAAHSPILFARLLCLLWM
jgi:hypothetical protein